MALLVGGEAWDLCCELDREEARPKLPHKSCGFFSALNNQDSISLTDVNYTLMVSSCSKVGTLPPYWDLLT
jgi:hypothetical protein